MSERKNPYEIIGGADKVEELVDRFYDLMSLEEVFADLRARHLPFKIGLKERNQWLACMYRAMEDCGIDGQIGAQLEESFFNTADWMRNQPN